MSTDTKFTPGPWRFYTEPQPNGCPIIGARGSMVAMLAHTIHQPEQKDVALSNARLIAAAPDMYRVLAWINRKGGMGLDVHDEIDAALAKARGEG